MNVPRTVSPLPLMASTRVHTLEYYGLREEPFAHGGNRPCEELVGTRRDALTALYLGVISGRNLLTILAADGLGKSLLLDELGARLLRTSHVALLHDAPHDRTALLRRTLAGYGVVSPSGSLAAMRDCLSAFAAKERRAGRRTVLIVDDAHDLGPSALDEVDRISALGGPACDHVQIVLAGRPSLADEFQKPGLEGLRQRQTLVSGLGPLSAAETAAYIDHRLRAAGYRAPTGVFTPEAIAQITASSGGVPGRIDAICHRALAVGLASQVPRIGRAIVEQAIGGPEANPPRQPPSHDLAEEPLAQSLPVAVGQGSMLRFPIAVQPEWSHDPKPGRCATDRHAPAPASRTARPVSELPPDSPSRSIPDPVAQPGSWRMHPLIEEALRTSEPAASAPWPPDDDAALFPNRAFADRSAATAEAPAVPAPSPREDRQTPTTARVSYALPADSPSLSKLVSSLLGVRAGTATRSFLFASVDQGAQTAQLCADVAKVIAAAGSSRVLVVDADRGSSVLREQFDVPPGPGLADILDGRQAIDAATIQVGPTLSLITAGVAARPGPACLLPQQVADLVGTLKSRFDFVLVNGMPLDRGGDSLEFGRNVDGVLMIVAAHATRCDAAREAKERLDAVGARLLGAVLTDRTFPIPDALYRRL